MRIAVRALEGALLGVVLAACGPPPPPSIALSPPESSAVASKAPGSEVPASSRGRKLGIRVRVDYAKGLGKQVDVALRIERPSQPSAQHLRAEWGGKLAFEVPEAMGWIAHVDREQLRFFRDGDTGPYTVYFVATPKLSGSWIGTGQTRGFLLHAGAE